MSQVNVQEATTKETVGNRQVDPEVVVKGERRQFLSCRHRAESAEEE